MIGFSCIFKQSAASINQSLVDVVVIAVYELSGHEIDVNFEIDPVSIFQSSVFSLVVSISSTGIV